MRKSIISLILAGSFIAPVWADTIQLQDQVPDRYVVVKGDTLWGIAGRFLKEPWRWPQIWQLNKEEIKNPHWIYPGDVIVLDRSGATPRLRLLRHEKMAANGEVKLSPQARSSSLAQAAPSISPAAIDPFLKRPLVIDEKTFASAPRIVGSHDNRVVFGTGDVVYAVNLQAQAGEIWQVFRDGKVLLDPDTKKPIGHEVNYQGDVRVEAVGDVATLKIVSAKEEISQGHRLIRAQEKIFINYSPRLPEQTVVGKVVSTYGGVADAGSLSTVVINRGADHGLEVGNILFTYKAGVAIKREGKEPKRMTPPLKSSNLFVYRVFPTISYGLLLDTSVPVNVGDEVSAGPDGERK